MTRQIILTLIAVLIVYTNTFAADLSKWQYLAPIEAGQGPEQYCSIKLTPQIYNAARRDLGDIRLINAAGEHVPYVVVLPGDKIGSQQYSPAIINRVVDANGAALVTLDFESRAIKNMVHVQTNGTSFRRSVKVECSSDNVRFFTLVESAYIFSFGNVSNRYDRIDLPDNDYRYLRITVRPMPAENDKPVIENVTAFKVAKEPAERDIISMLLIQHTEEDKTKHSVYEYDFGYHRLPISEINLDISDESFYRYVTIYGRESAVKKVPLDSEDNRRRFRQVDVPWEIISSQAIYRYISPNGDKKEDTTVRFSPAERAYRYVKLTIENYDDTPLTLRSASAKMVAHKIIFDSGNIPTSLYVGSDAAAPAYDIQKLLTRPLEATARPAKLGELVDNPLFNQGPQKQVPWTEEHKNILLAVMVLVVAALGVFIFKSLKSIKQQQNA